MLNDKIALFCECFGDSEETARDFYSCSDILTVSLHSEDRLVAMASLVPILAVDDDAFGYYIYGVCVAPEKRGRGFFRQIMNAAEEAAQNNGAVFSCLVPADDGLANTYKKMGYNIEIAPKTSSFKGNGLKLGSNEFRNFAKVDDNTVARRSGLLKVFNEKGSLMCNKELCFLDDMGDV